MKLPNGGNIVVVDDKYSEIEPLIEFFGRYGVSVNYFKGPQGVFPEIPLVGTLVSTRIICPEPQV